MIDGLNNTVMQTDIVPLDPSAEGGPIVNHALNAFTTRTTPVLGATDFDFATDRRWAIVNPSRAHSASGKPAGYSVMHKGALVPLMARDGSWIAKRAGFARRALWVVRDPAETKDGKAVKETRMWPAGKYVPGTRVAPADCVEGWVKEDEAEGGVKPDGEDVIAYFTVGVTHVPRPEDWPVYVLFFLRRFA